MTFLSLIIGFLMFCLGVGYLFFPQLVLKFNAFMRDTFFKDSVVLLGHRRLGILLLLLSFILLAFAKMRH